MTESSALLRAASRKHADPAAILAVAQSEGLPARQLARIVDRLRETAPNWKLPKRDRDRLIDALLSDGVSLVRITGWIGCSRPTVRKRAEAIAAPDRGTPAHRLNKRSKCKEMDFGNGFPILSFDASSGGSLTLERHMEILRLLGVRP